ncbi:MAG: hypothetical protein JWO20_1655 [Candidatus Angelobacter sp.]|nr:hypothetical protein [Candidatus Angelobacter sp.]
MSRFKLTHNPTRAENKWRIRTETETYPQTLAREVEINILL